MILLKRKLYSIFKDKDDDGDWDLKDIQIQIDEWRKPKFGHPKAAFGIGAGVTGLAAYGGVKAGENIMNHKLAKESVSKAKKVLLDKVNNEIKKGTITKEQAKKALSNPEKLKKLLTKFGNLDRIVDETSRTAKPRMKKAKIIGGVAAGLAPLAGTLYVANKEQEKEDLMKFGPKKIEVGHVNLVQKKKKKDK